MCRPCFAGDATKVGLSVFMKKIEVLSDRWLMIEMLFVVEIVYLCVWPKNSTEIEIVYTHSSHNRVDHKVVFLIFLSIKTPLFYTKNTGLVHKFGLNKHSG